MTLSQRHDGGELAELLRFFPSTVEVPPLRHHVEDVQELVPFFLARLVTDGRLVCSPEAMQLLVRSSWPGNIEQLWQVLRRIVQHRRTGAIQPDDLPPECRTVSRRLLSPLEAMERDAIVRSLIDWDGNKIKAARVAGHVARHDLPQDPRVRHRGAHQLAAGPPPTTDPEVSTRKRLDRGCNHKPPAGPVRDDNARDDGEARCG